MQQITSYFYQVEYNHDTVHNKTYELMRSLKTIETSIMHKSKILQFPCHYMLSSVSVPPYKSSLLRKIAQQSAMMINAAKKHKTAISNHPMARELGRGSQAHLRPHSQAAVLCLEIFKWRTISSIGVALGTTGMDHHNK